MNLGREQVDTEGFDSEVNYMFDDMPVGHKPTQKFILTDNTGRRAKWATVQIKLGEGMSIMILPGTTDGQRPNETFNRERVYPIDGFSRIHGMLWLDIKGKYGKRRFKYISVYPIDALVTPKVFDQKEIEAQEEHLRLKEEQKAAQKKRLEQGPSDITSCDEDKDKKE